MVATEAILAAEAESSARDQAAKPPLVPKSHHSHYWSRRRPPRPLATIRYHKTGAAKLQHRGRRRALTDSHDSPLRAGGCTMGACLGKKEKPEVHRSLRTQHKSAKQNMMRQRDTDIAQFYDIDATIGRGSIGTVARAKHKESSANGTP